MSKKDEIISNRIPRHIAIIMDGNGRWAKKQGLARMIGHRQGVTTVHNITEAAAELGIEYLTLYAFSTENWNRPKEEVDALMSLLVDTIAKEVVYGEVANTHRSEVLEEMCALARFDTEVA